MAMEASHPVGRQAPDARPHQHAEQHGREGVGGLVQVEDEPLQQWEFHPQESQAEACEVHERP